MEKMLADKKRTRGQKEAGCKGLVRAADWEKCNKL